MESEVREPEWLNKPYKEWNKVPTHLLMLAKWALIELALREKKKAKSTLTE